MEPCLFRHGKGLRILYMMVGAVLQWSHVFSDMVSPYSLIIITFPALLQWSHVFSDMVRCRVCLFSYMSPQASMEPCLFRHGKRRPGHSSPLPSSALQWSHVFSDMVRTGRTLYLMRRRKASMEPCLFRHGKRPAPRSQCQLRSFNGAMSFQTW